MGFLKAGDVAVIVGSATGIGRAAARKWASQGVKLALFDNSEERLGPLVEELKGKTSVVAFNGNVTHEHDLETFKSIVYSQFDRVDLLFLNAGIQLDTGFADHSDAIKKIFNVNFFGVVNGVTAFIESLKAQATESRVVITGSKQGITNPPGNPGYNASKAAVKSFAEGLSFSLQGTKVEAHLLIPGWTHTYLTGDRDTEATSKPAPAWTPEEVVDRLDSGLESGEFYILCPDNEVTVELDKKRMAWSVGDIIQGRPALSRWRPQYKDEFAKLVKEN
jgi:NAD(P)-dependent dehydrogenase (short-subunit alcohol dehydrogenase family)